MYSLPKLAVSPLPRVLALISRVLSSTTVPRKVHSIEEPQLAYSQEQLVQLREHISFYASVAVPS